MDNTTIVPTPDDDEAAAILVALTTYLTEQRRAPAEPARTVPRWALAGRLASQGIALRRLPGAAVGWKTIGRKSVASSQ